MRTLRTASGAIFAVILAAFAATSVTVARAEPAPLPCSDPMVMTFDTRVDPGTKGHVGFVLTGGSGTVTIDWGGAGSATPSGEGPATDQRQTYPADPGLVGFDFASPGAYTVSVCGTPQGFASPQSRNGVGASTLTSVSSFGSLGITDYSGAFLGATHLTKVPTSLPSGVTRVQSMFEGAVAFDGDVSAWDTSGVTTMRSMFDGATSFDQDLGRWDVTHVADMTRMFSGVRLSSSNYDALLTGWATQKVPTGVAFDAGSSSYSAAAAQPRATLTGAAGWSITDSGQSGAATPSDGGTFVSLAPTRVLDTRTNNGASGPVPARGTIHVQLAGRGGIPADGVGAVVVNLTVTNSSRPGHITAYQDGTPQPSSSNLNFPAGDTRANLAVVTLGADGKIALTNNSEGTVHLIADVSGYYLAGIPTAAGAYAPLTPDRILDTRTDTGATGPVPANATIRVQVAGRGGVPASGVSAVVLNLTETGSTAPGHLIVHADGTAEPGTSNLNFPRADTRASLVVVKVGANGSIAIANRSPGTVHVVGDIVGYHLAGSGDAAGRFEPLTPSRVLDTRIGAGGTGPVAPDGSLRVQIAGRGGVPTSGVSAVVLNLTGTNATRPGHVSAYPSGSCEPNASSLNLPGGDTRNNLAVVPLGADGTLSLTSHNRGTVQLIADVVGYFTPNAVPAVAPSFQSLAQNAISARHSTLGTQLGAATTGVVLDGCIAHQTYAKGVIVYTNFTGAHAVHGPIYSRYTALGGYPRTGVPTTEVVALANYSGGSVSRFTRGALVSSDHGVRWLTTEAADHYLAHGAGKYGAPISDTTSATAPYTADSWTKLAGAGQTSATSMLYRNTASGIHWVRGPIYQTWVSLKLAAGPLGRPTSNEYTKGVTMQRFTSGAIMRGTNGWPAVHGDVWRVYSSTTHNAATGDLGLPTGPGSQDVQDFQNARIDHGRIRVRVNATTHTTTSAEVQYTFRSGCPVGPSSLRTISMNHLGFDNRVHRGVMIVRSDVVTQIIDSFSAAAWNSFQIRQMVNPNHWLGNDYKMMAADNTSAFNCRKVSGNPYAMSPHSYGRAIDINDFENPYKEFGVWYPYENWYATHRDPSKPGVLVGTSTLTTKLVGHGFYWGAWWSEPDYQHFQK
ncbi:BspA family leucine-rich repeat surface protein [Aestuariimicrobium kwangyangense]|uniref:BspA family leucine-rich repeat surface protein n=1 Tax=Aestuariimicrobium kwangyangense TaxID=396389 RepID=UPI0004154AEB|nr:BspA family leucine-rich repeat surface protein [Aestuariimicrobium kwangyangense]